MHIHVSNLAGCEAAFKAHDPQIVLSLLDPGLAAPELRSRALVAHHIYRLWDIESNPGAELRFVVSSICGVVLAAFRELGPNCRFLVHCNAGASRSTAAAYIIMNIMRGPGSEDVAFAELLGSTNKPWPNAAIVQEADRVLLREGRLSAALDRYRQTHPRRPDAYRRLNRRRGIAPVDLPDAQCALSPIV